jgi:hypothetical protein
LEEDMQQTDTPARHGGHRATFHSDRIFYHSSLETGTAGWCFEVRGGRVYGPFQTKEIAERILNGLIEVFKRTGNTGGRLDVMATVTRTTARAA